ncbi:MAG: hypothetical protein ACO3GG_05325 [Ilumatobacteraceae bacterium]
MILRPTHRTSPTLALLGAIPLALLAACGGGTETEKSDTPEPSITTSETTAESPTTTEAPIETSSPYGLPSDYVAPPGWVESTSRFDDAVGAFVESVADPRFTSFVWTAEGCCDAGLDATFGSPELPDSDVATDLGDGLYLAAISDWDPADPNWLTMKIWRIVDCGSDEAVDVYYCSINDFLPGRFEALETSETFRVRLDDNFSVQMSAALEPIEGDSYYTNYSWLAQGPTFADFLVELHDAYSALVTEPFRAGASYADVAVNLFDEPRFRAVELGESFMPFGAWQPPDGPALTFHRQDSLVPICYADSDCIDGGDSQLTPAAFESLFNDRASLHVAGGRMAFVLLGASLGG